MIRERLYNSFGEFTAHVKKDAAIGNTRDFRADSELVLCLSEIGEENRIFEYMQNPDPDIPILVVANHFTRTILQRDRSLSSLIGTTKEAILTSALITTGLRRLRDEKIAWFVKGDFSGASASLGEKEAQEAAVKCYDQIAVTQGNANEALKQAIVHLKDGHNLGLYPEATVGDKWVQMGLRGYQLGPHHHFFEALLLALYRARIEFQILPVSVYYENRKFHATFCELIESRGKPKATAKLAMERIAKSLPAKLKSA